MGMSGKYVAAIQSIGEVVEGIFNRTSPHCRFYEKRNERAGDFGLGECLHNGRKESHVCAREICPLLEKEE